MLGHKCFTIYQHYSAKEEQGSATVERNWCFRTHIMTPLLQINTCCRARWTKCVEVGKESRFQKNSAVHPVWEMQINQDQQHTITLENICAKMVLSSIDRKRNSNSLFRCAKVWIHQAQPTTNLWFPGKGILAWANLTMKKEKQRARCQFLLAHQHVTSILLRCHVKEPKMLHID